MKSLVNVLTGTKVLEQTSSKYNGEIVVMRDLAFGTYIKVGGLTQSGNLIKQIWRTTIKKTKIDKLNIKSGLLLGLGGGSIVHVWRKFWPEIVITAVDIDRKMVEMGEKYMKLDTRDIDLIISDAWKVVKNLKAKGATFDLIGVDLYCGDVYPDKFENPKFPGILRELISDVGVVIFNRLYYGEKRPMSVKFGRMLEKIFTEVKVVYPEANIMFVCKK